jgi:hypothetical protein
MTNELEPLYVGSNQTNRKVRVRRQLIAALPEKWKKGEDRELVCLSYIKETTWLKAIGIHRNIYQFHLRTRKLTAVPYRLQNKWEEIVDVPWFVNW